METLGVNFDVEGNKKNIIIASVVAVIFATGAIWFYFSYVQPSLHKDYVTNKEFLNGARKGSSASVIFFGTTWCPHCKTATQPWEEYKTSVGGDKASVNGVSIDFREVDCDKEPKIAAQYKVKGYPTIIYERGDQVVEFDSKPTLPLLTKFVNQMTSDS